MATPSDGKSSGPSAQLVKELRDKTGAGFSDCRAALVESGGDIQKAIDVLRKKGQAAAAKKAQRSTSEGLVSCYIHAGGKIGVLVEINCESDFVARTEDFQRLSHDVAMHIAALDPRFLRREDVTQETLDREREIYREQAKATGKPATGDRQDRPGQDGKILRRKLPLRAALHQGRRNHGQGDGRSGHRQGRREHRHPPLRAIQGRRNGCHHFAGGHCPKIPAPPSRFRKA